MNLSTPIVKTYPLLLRKEVWKTEQEYSCSKCCSPIKKDDTILISEIEYEMFCISCGLDILNTQVDYLIPLRNLCQYIYQKEYQNAS